MKLYREHYTQDHINDYLFHVSINGVLEIIIVKILKLKNK
jgi:hypothetical protein